MRRAADPPARAVLQVKDPCCGRCPVEIPVCIPVCCTDAPKVRCRCGLLGRGYVTYEDLLKMRERA